MEKKKTMVKVGKIRQSILLIRCEKVIIDSVFVVRAFVQLRETIAGHKELARKIAKLERKLVNHDEQIMVLVECIFPVHGGTVLCANEAEKA